MNSKAPRPHPILHGGTFGLMAGDKPMYPASIEANHENLVRVLKQMGLKHEQTHGRYGEPERSVIIHNPREDQMKTLGKLFGQESIIHSSKGQHRLIYTNGPDEGKHRGTTPGLPPHEWSENPPDDNYTHIPGNGHFRINFDFNQEPQGNEITPGLKKSQDQMPGGKGDNKPDSDFSPEALALGVKIEIEEHGLDEDRAKEIAKDHLTENPSYYNKELNKSIASIAETPVILIQYNNGVKQVTKKTYTPEEAAEIAMEFGRMRINQIAKSLQELHHRELKKAIIPPHKHNTGTVSSSGIEDIPPGKSNPPGKNDVMKEESSSEETREETSGEESPEETSMSKEELCKECGKGHELEKGCTPVHTMDKSIIKDSKGKTIDNGIVSGSNLPGDKDSEEVSHDGSGGEITKGKTVKKSLSDIHKLAKAFAPPMAKPPSGKNMGTHVPTSKPAGSMTKVVLPPTPNPQQGVPQAIVAKEVKEMVVHNSKTVKPPKGADYKAKQEGTKAVYTAKEELEKGVMADIARRNSPPGPEAPAATPKVTMPTPEQHAERAAQFQSFTPPAATTGHTMKPGIFGRLGKSELAKAIPGKSVTTSIPSLKPAAAGLHTVGGAPGNTSMTPTLPHKTQESTTAGVKPTSLQAAPVDVGANVDVFKLTGAPPLKANPNTKSVAPRPTLKPAGAQYATAGAGSSPTDSDKTAGASTNPASPKALAAKPKV